MSKTNLDALEVYRAWRFSSLSVRCTAKLFETSNCQVERLINEGRRIHNRIAVGDKHTPGLSREK
tara:strand:+ start:351 stop:545 length:195 start_codon:yes stop_codon:yes gene_type:complete